MILPDINVLIYAYNPAAPEHSLARKWWDACLAGEEPVGLAWVVVLGFIRITTLPKLHANPMSAKQACATVAEWLTLPHYHLVNPTPGHFERLSAQFEKIGVAGNMTTDAHLAALASERGYILHTTDADFSRFPGLKWINPLTLPTSS